MKDKRNMFYSNTNAGGFIDPNINMAPNMMPQQQMMNPGSMMPSGYNMNNNYMSFGPNAMPQQQMGQPMNQPMMGQPSYDYGYTDTSYVAEDYESRLTKLERQIRKLDNRVSKLESSTLKDVEKISIDSNLYMI